MSICIQMYRNVDLFKGSFQASVTPCVTTVCWQAGGVHSVKDLITFDEIFQRPQGCYKYPLSIL